MSLGEADAKFPGQHGVAEPPSPSRENPGRVYPKSDPSLAPPGSIPETRTSNSSQRYLGLGNPFLQSSLFHKLDQALMDVIGTIENEQSEMGGSAEEVRLVEKFKGWRDELKGIMSGDVSVRGGAAPPPTDGVPAKEGGMFVD